MSVNMSEKHRLRCVCEKEKLQAYTEHYNGNTGVFRSA